MQKKLIFLTVLMGSFLSFAIEPLIGRVLLPMFGGTPCVWVSCLAAFQLLMVAGYFYAGRIVNAQRTTAYRKVHLLLLAFVAIWCMTLSFGSTRILESISTLTNIGPLDVLLSVLVLVGLTFILLSANVTLVQGYSKGSYRYYAVSNIGSLLGLFTYPVLLEPFFALSTQWMIMGTGIFAYLILLAYSTSGKVAGAVSSLTTMKQAVRRSTSEMPLKSPCVESCISSCRRSQPRF